MRITLFIVIVGFLGAITTDACAIGKNKKEKDQAEKEAFVKTMNTIDLNASGNTSLGIKNSWTSLKGKEVTWTATVVDVKGGRGKAQIYAKKDGKPIYKGYNLIITTFDEGAASALRKDETFRFKGMIESKKQRRGGPLVLYIGNAQIVEKK